MEQKRYFVTSVFPLLLKGKRYGTKNSLPYIMDSKNSVNVDNQIDLMVVKQIMNSKKGKI